MSEEGEFFCLLYWRVFSKSDVTLNVFLYYWSFFTRERNTNSCQRNWQLLRVMSYKEKHLRGCQTLKSTKRRGDKKITLVVIREIFVYCKQWILNVKPPNLVILKGMCIIYFSEVLYLAQYIVTFIEVIWSTVHSQALNLAFIIKVWQAYHPSKWHSPWVLCPFYWGKGEW